MQRSDSPTPQIPPEVARYLRGAPSEARQFDFLIGTWDVSATRYKDDGSVLLQYKASWNAQTLNEGRMIIDDFKALAPTGEPISSFVTLRTYSDATRRWELQGLAALQPTAARSNGTDSGGMVKWCWMPRARVPTASRSKLESDFSRLRRIDSPGRVRLVATMEGPGFAVPP
jgi:hypothetical protein